MWDEPLKRCRSSALNSPFLVERVQNYFGVYRLSAPKNDSVPNGVQRNGYTSAAVVGHASVPCRVELPVWYYVFRFGSLLGYEAFYATFFPFILWNWDAVVCRRVLLVWALVMYCGGLTKDLLRWPRPASPPVVQLDRAYAAEFGMPSTHAMTGASVPFGLLLWTQQRYQLLYSHLPQTRALREPGANEEATQPLALHANKELVCSIHTSALNTEQLSIWKTLNKWYSPPSNPVLLQSMPQHICTACG
nr:sphingosine-1-phosphate phosphatase 2-like [Rhipicephalus microplus]